MINGAAAEQNSLLNTYRFWHMAGKIDLLFMRFIGYRLIVLQA